MKEIQKGYFYIILGLICIMGGISILFTPDKITELSVFKIIKHSNNKCLYHFKDNNNYVVFLYESNCNKFKLNESILK